MKRRNFLLNSALLLSMSHILSACSLSSNEIMLEPNKVPRRKFKDITLPLLSLGCLRLPLKNNDINMKEFSSMVSCCMEHGVNYFDTGFFYINHKSEIALAEALKKYKRKDYYIATKINPLCLKGRNDFLKRFNIELKKLQTDYIDFYLVHSILNQESLNMLEKTKMYDDLLMLKNKGKVKYIGFSFHGGPDILKQLIKKYEFDFCYLVTNYFDLYIDKDNKKIHDIVKTKNIPVIAMEPLCGGKLVNLHKDAERLFKENYPGLSPIDFGLRWAASQNNIISIMSGMNNLEQVKQNIGCFTNFKKIEDQKQVCKKIAEIINDANMISCTTCSYCTEKCPQNIDIPNIFTLYNKYRNEKTEESFKNLSLKLKNSKPCIKCGNCSKICPQRLIIPEEFDRIYSEVKV